MFNGTNVLRLRLFGRCICGDKEIRLAFVLLGRGGHCMIDKSVYELCIGLLRGVGTEKKNR